MATLCHRMRLVGRQHQVLRPEGRDKPRLLTMGVLPVKWATLPLKPLGDKRPKGFRAIQVLASLDPAEADGKDDEDNDDEDWDARDPDLANDEFWVPDEFDEEEPEPDDRDFWQEPDELED
jgi:hypothetical protein